MAKDAFQITEIRRARAAGRRVGHEVRRFAAAESCRTLHGGPGEHPSAEPNTLVVRADIEQREALMEDAPGIYYLTDYYRRYPLVLARLAQMDHAALHDLLSVFAPPYAGQAPSEPPRWGFLPR